MRGGRRRSPLDRHRRHERGLLRLRRRPGEGHLEGPEGYRATAETTSASVDNLILIGDGGSDIAFTLADTALDAVEGREAFKEQVPMRALAQIYDNYTQVVAKAGSGIKTIEDLKGKRVSVGAPNSGTEVIADRVSRRPGSIPRAASSARASASRSRCRR